MKAALKEIVKLSVARITVCGKVMFSVVSVCHSVYKGGGGGCRHVISHY